MFDVNKCLGDAEEQMELAIIHLEDEYAHIRAGKANVRILDDIRVDSYGTMVALDNVAALSTPDVRTIAIRPWDRNMLKVIEKAIINSSVGIMPTNNGEIIRLAIPPLTEERRRELVRQSGKANENTKISIRNARRDSMEYLKRALKDGLSEEAKKDAEDKLQKLHDKYIKKSDELFAEKEKEIMTI
jgi:ribosome recycling factor